MRRLITLLDEAAGRELVLPVTPGAYQWTHEANIESVTVDQLGDLNFFGGLRMGSTTLTDCLLPAHAYPFLFFPQKGVGKKVQRGGLPLWTPPKGAARATSPPAC